MNQVYDEKLRTLIGVMKFNFDILEQNDNVRTEDRNDFLIAILSELKSLCEDILPILLRVKKLG